MKRTLSYIGQYHMMVALEPRWHKLVALEPRWHKRV